MRPRSRFVLIGAGLVLAAATGFTAWRSQTRDADGSYVTEALERGSVAAVVTATGTVNPVSTVQVGTYVSGPIRAIYADYNAPVRQGQLVAKIDPAPFETKVRSAMASVATARARVQKDVADLTLKKLTLERTRELVGKQLVSQSDLDTARSAHEQALAQTALDRAGVQQAEADLETARINLAYTEIRSPVDGVVVSRNVDVGQTVAASFQTPTLFLIAQDLTKMQVDSNVSESDIGAVTTGQPVTFRVDAYPDKSFHGTVTQVRNAPITVQSVVTYDVVLTVDNPDLELRPGMTATVAITTAERDAVLKVPLRALRFHPESAAAAPPGEATDGAATPRRGSGVWVQQPDGQLRRVEVRTGVRDDRHAELLAGDLHENDLLVVAVRRTPLATVSQPPPFMPGRRTR